MSERRDVRLLVLVTIACIALQLAGGCAGRQQAVELYVDAVSLKELNENDKAIAKLNQATKADKRFSLAHSLLGEIYEQKQDYPKERGIIRRGDPA